LVLTRLELRNFYRKHDVQKKYMGFPRCRIYQLVVGWYVFWGYILTSVFCILYFILGGRSFALIFISYVSIYTVFNVYYIYFSFEKNNSIYKGFLYDLVYNSMVVWLLGFIRLCDRSFLFRLMLWGGDNNYAKRSAFFSVYGFINAVVFVFLIIIYGR
jgi:hypothetical protein